MAKQQWEEEAINRFIAFINSSEGVSYGISGRDVKVVNGKDFDYQISSDSGNKKAVELFRLVESEEELAKGRAWGEVVDKLRTEVKNRNLQGFLVYTPDFTFKRNQLDNFANSQVELIEDAIKNAPQEKKFSKNGYEFHKIEKFPSISFSNSLRVRSIDSIGTALKSFTKLLPTKNKQLEVEDHSRVLLVINWAYFVDAKDAVKALSKIDFETYKNIDEVYYETKPNEFSCVFDRKVYKALKDKTPLDSIELLPLMIENIDHLLNEGDESGFEYLKTHHELIPALNHRVKEDLVRYTETRLKEKKDITSAVWLIDLLKFDQSPKNDGSNSEDDPQGEYNYHTKILNGDEANLITTVRGHLCWLMSIVIVQNDPSLYREIINILKTYFSENNLYIKIQATYPLLELSRRIRATKNQDESPFDWNNSEREEVKNLVFEILQQNKEYPRVLHAILHIFQYMRDLSENDAKEMLSIMLNTKKDYVLHDLAPLLLYYALFRKDNFLEEGVFNSVPFEEMVMENILNGDENLRSSMAWHLWQVLKDDLMKYSDISKYIEAYFVGEYNQHTYSMLMFGIEEIAKKDPKTAVSIFKKVITKIKDYIETHTEGYPYYINSSEEIIDILSSEPDELIGLMDELKSLWLKRIYVGDVKTIFEVYKKVAPDRKSEVKGKMQEIYKEIKKVNPHLVELDWLD
jgi:hypothetical protein